MRVGAARKSDPQCLAHDRTSAVAAGDEDGLYGLLRPIGPPQTRPHPCTLVLEANKFRGALDRDAHLREAIDQEALMLVLRKDERVGEGADALSHVAEDDATLLL